jgi:hypothetical protein
VAGVRWGLARWPTIGGSKQIDPGPDHAGESRYVPGT